MLSKTILTTKLALSAAALLAISGCVSTGGTGAVPADFSISGSSISPLAPQNLCRAIGGQDTQPVLTISHTPVEGVPLRVRMYDVTSDGTVYEHNVVRTTSEPDGTTVVSSGFLPPCNRSGGVRNSSYRFDISAGEASETVIWGAYDSTLEEIVY